MLNDFSVYRVVCSTPSGLEPERDTFLATIADFAGRVTLPERILFPPASFPNGFDATRFQAAVRDNIAGAYFFLGFFGEDSCEPVYKRLVQYALECQADAALPMKLVTVFFKDTDDVAEEIRALRSRFEGKCRVRTYADLQELAPYIEEFLTECHALIQP